MNPFQLVGDERITVSTFYLFIFGVAALRAPTCSIWYCSPTTNTMNVQHRTCTPGQRKSNRSSILVWNIPGRTGALTVLDTIQASHGFSDKTDTMKREIIAVPVRTIYIGEHCLPQMVDVAISCMTAPAIVGTSIQRPQVIEINFDGNAVVDCWQQETTVEIGFQGLPVIKTTYSLVNMSRKSYDGVTRFFLALGHLGHMGVTDVVIKGLELDEWEGELLFGDYVAADLCSEDCSDDDCSNVAFDSRTKSIQHNRESNNDTTPVITFRDCSLEDPVIRMFQRLYQGSVRHHLAEKRISVD